MSNQTAGVKAQIFPSSDEARKAVASGEVEYALQKKVFNNQDHTYVYCSAANATALSKKYKRNSKWRPESSTMMSVKGTKAEEVLAKLL